MNVTATSLPGVMLVVPQIHEDDRGQLFEAFRADAFAAAGIPGRFVQDNVSFSQRGVLRGLHLQHPHGQGKLVTALHGEVYDVAVDARAGSPNFGRWTAARLSARNRQLLYVPPGFAHGFVVLSAQATVLYKCTDYYHPETAFIIRWNDPRIGIDWPVSDVTLSQRDAGAPRLDEIAPDSLPPYDSAGR